MALPESRFIFLIVRGDYGNSHSISSALSSVLKSNDSYDRCHPSIRRTKGLCGKFFSQYPVAFRALNQAIGIECAESDLALVHLQIFCGRFQVVPTEGY
jgi:hypothetical protein